MLNLLRNELSQRFANSIGCTKEQFENLLESPKSEGHGHLSLPVFQWAKLQKKAPAAIAAEWAQNFDANKGPKIKKVTAVSGFVNFEFLPSVVQDLLTENILNDVERIGHSAVGAGKRLLIDFSSPNVAKPMHVGHLRATVIGQAIVNLAKTQGFEVVGINHLGDWGVQFGKLAWAYNQWGSEYPFEAEPFESLYKLYVRFHEEAEKDPELEKAGSKLFRQLEMGDAEVHKLWQKFVSISLQDYQRIWNRLRVRHDLVRGESFYNDRLKPVEDLLQKKGLLIESDGAEVVRLDEEGMPPCLIRKSDGASLYATRDLACGIYRMEELKGDLNLYVVGVDQTLHFRQVFKVLEKAGFPWVDRCHHIAFGMYRFKDARISTRKGNAIFLEDVLNQARDLVRDVIAQKNPDLKNADIVAEQVGVGAVIFNDLMNDRVKNVDFDWDRALDFEGDSGPYVQYCGVRCLSLMRKYGQPIRSKISLELSSPEEKELLRVLLNYQDTLASAFEHFKPHFVASYLLDVCHKYGAFYNRCRILGESPDIEQARMTLVAMVQAVVQHGLGVLSIEQPKAM